MRYRKSQVSLAVVHRSSCRSDRRCGLAHTPTHMFLFVCSIFGVCLNCEILTAEFSRSTVYMRLLPTICGTFFFPQRKLLHFLKELSQHFVVRLKKYVCSFHTEWRVKWCVGGGSIGVGFSSSLVQVPWIEASFCLTRHPYF